MHPGGAGPGAASISWTVDGPDAGCATAGTTGAARGATSMTTGAAWTAAARVEVRAARCFFGGVARGAGETDLRRRRAGRAGVGVDGGSTGASTGAGAIAFATANVAEEQVVRVVVRGFFPEVSCSADATLRQRVWRATTGGDSTPSGEETASIGDLVTAAAIRAEARTGRAPEEAEGFLST